MALIERRVPTLLALLAMAAPFGLLAGLFCVEGGSDAAASPVVVAPPLASAAAAVTATAGAPVPASATPQAAPEPRFGIVRVRPGAEVVLLSAPGGRRVGTLGSQTEFGSPMVLSVVATRPGWVGVATPELPNGQLGWIRRDPRRLSFSSTRYSLHADLSQHRLTLRDGSKTVRRFTVSVGAPGSETPTGRFAITDELHYEGNPYYGCCVLALSGRQTHLPPGWTGGDRLAIHGSPNPVGGNESAGCIHATEDALRMLISRVPPGTPVFVHG